MHETPPEIEETVVPHLTVNGAHSALDLYTRAFGAEVLYQQEMPDGTGKLIHAAMRIGNSMVMLVDAFPEFGNAGPDALGGTPVTLHLTVEDCDAAVARAVDAGCTVLMEPSDAFWGDRYAKVADPFGHHWSIAAHVRDVTREEMDKAVKEMMGGG